MRNFLTFTACFLFVASLLFLGARFLEPSKEDIQDCTESTNYTHDRCLWEITR